MTDQGRKGRELLAARGALGITELGRNGAT